jgi:hypothetical protein
MLITYCRQIYISLQKEHELIFSNKILLVVGGSGSAQIITFPETRGPRPLRIRIRNAGSERSIIAIKMCGSNLFLGYIYKFSHQKNTFPDGN